MLIRIRPLMEESHSLLHISIIITLTLIRHRATTKDPLLPALTNPIRSMIMVTFFLSYSLFTYLFIIGEHNAENEEYILSIIKQYEESNYDHQVLTNKLFDLAITQTGSRFLQKQLTKANPLLIQFILQEVNFIVFVLCFADLFIGFCRLASIFRNLWLIIMGIISARNCF